MSADLRRAFVAAYPGYVRDRTGGVDVSDAVDAGSRWLDDELAALFAQPFSEQARSPLELFQEAMRFPTEALSAAGVPPVPREAAAEQALPGDIYGLAPASSHDLGEKAWQAHLAWGAAKARAMTAPPVVLHFGANLMDRTTIAGATDAHVVSVADAGVLPGDPEPMLALVDLTHPDCDAAVSALAAAGVRTIAFGPHVDDVALVRARSLGADDALPRSLFFRRLQDLLPGRT